MIGFGAMALAAELSWCLYVVGRGSDAGLSLFVVLASVWGGGALVLLWSIRLVLYVVATRKVPESRRWRQWAIEPLALMVCFTLAWSGLAFRARFLLSRPALDRYARAPTVVAPHYPPTQGPRVGLFWIREAEVLPGGVVRMITTDCMFDDCGLAYSPGGEPPVIGEDRYTALGGGWWHWWRSW